MQFLLNRNSVFFHVCLLVLPYFFNYIKQVSVSNCLSSVIIRYHSKPLIIVIRKPSPMLFEPLIDVIRIHLSMSMVFELLIVIWKPSLMSFGIPRRCYSESLIDAISYSIREHKRQCIPETLLCINIS